MSCNGCKWQCIYGVCYNENSERCGDWANVNFICDKREDEHDTEKLSVLRGSGNNLQG